jgi:hypothetical protein
MNHRRLTLAVLVVAVAAGPVVGAGHAQQGSGSPAVAITNVTVTPEQPTAGDTFEVQATVRNDESAGASFEVQELYVDRPGGRSYVADKLGTLAPGSSTTVSIPVTVDSTGQYTLSIKASGTTRGGRVVIVRQPVPVRVVGEQRPQVNIVGSNWEAGTATTANVTVANGRPDPIRGLELTLGGETATLDSATRVRASLAGETSVTYSFDVVPQRVGTQQLTARLQYTGPAGDAKTVSRTQTIAVSERDPGLSLALSADEVGPSGETAFDLTVVNERQDAITGIRFGFESEDGQMVDEGTVIPSLQSGTETTARLDLRNVEPGPHDLSIDASYTTAGGEQERFSETLSTTVQAVEEPGNVSLSELQIGGRGTSVSVRGSVSNPGTTGVSGVEIRVAEGELVGPAPSQSSFFVGNITSSDFTNFQVNAQLRAPTNRSVTVPVAVSYVVDGVRQERVIDLQYDPRSVPSGGPEAGAGGPPQQGGGLPLVPVAVALVVVALGAIGWRRYRG